MLFDFQAESEREVRPMCQSGSFSGIVVVAMRVGEGAFPFELTAIRFTQLGLKAGEHIWIVEEEMDGWYEAKAFDGRYPPSHHRTRGNREKRLLFFPLPTLTTPFLVTTCSQQNRLRAFRLRTKGLRGRDQAPKHLPARIGSICGHQRYIFFLASALIGDPGLASEVAAELGAWVIGGPRGNYTLLLACSVTHRIGWEKIALNEFVFVRSLAAA